VGTWRCDPLLHAFQIDIDSDTMRHERRYSGMV
jgi:hypothetical protein